MQKGSSRRIWKKWSLCLQQSLEIGCLKRCWNGQGILFPRFQRCSIYDSKRARKGFIQEEFE
jgi:hypothetical protein